MDEQGSEWVAFIAKELDREYDRRDRLNTRSATAITSATTLVTVALAVVAVLKGQHLVVSGVLQVGSLLGALLSLLAAAVLSILAGATRSRFEVAAVNDMNRMLGADLWGADNVDARNYTAQLNLVAIRSLRTGNGFKYRFLVLSLSTQAIGAFLLAVFAIAVVTR
jgi:hypothetical protein